MIRKSEVQVLTHCDPRRAVRACMLASSTPSDIEVICAVNGSMTEVERRLGSIAVPQNLRFVPGPAKPVYPANQLRNTALAASEAERIFYIDADFVFSRDFWGVLLPEHRRLAVGREKICLCPVALWDPDGAYLSGPRIRDLIDVETPDFHHPPRCWSEAARSRLFKYHKRCFKDPFATSEKDSYEITNRMLKFRYSFRPAEPWGLLGRKEAVWADEDFADGPMDKQQFVCSLLDRGMRFIAAPAAFIFHLWHPEERLGWPDGARNLSIWLRRHSRLPHRYLLIGIDGILPPHLARGLEVHVGRLVEDCEQISSSQTNCGNIVENVQGSDSCDACAEQKCLEAMKSGQRVVVGPSYLPRAVLGLEHRVCVFFQSPSFYRLRGPKALTADSADSDCSYIYRVAHTRSLAEAAARVENAAVLCDAGNPAACAMALQNLLGISIPPEWLSEWKAIAFPAETADAQIAARTRYPTDYRFYDYLRVLAGTS